MATIARLVLLGGIAWGSVLLGSESGQQPEGPVDSQHSKSQSRARSESHGAGVVSAPDWILPFASCAHAECIKHCVDTYDAHELDQMRRERAHIDAATSHDPTRLQNLIGRYRGRDGLALLNALQRALDEDRLPLLEAAQRDFDKHVVGARFTAMFDRLSSKHRLFISHGASDEEGVIKIACSLPNDSWQLVPLGCEERPDSSAFAWEHRAIPGRWLRPHESARRMQQESEAKVAWPPLRALPALHGAPVDSEVERAVLQWRVEQKYGFGAPAVFDAVVEQLYTLGIHAHVTFVPGAVRQHDSAHAKYEWESDGLLWIWHDRLQVRKKSRQRKRVTRTAIERAVHAGCNGDKQLLVLCPWLSSPEVTTFSWRRTESES